MPMSNQASVFGHQNYNTSTYMFQYHTSKAFFVQDRPKGINNLQYIQETWQKLFIASYSLMWHPDIHNCSGHQKREHIATHLQITCTLFHQQQTEWMSVNIWHKRNHVLCQEYAFSFFGLISSLMLWRLIITTKSWRLKSVNLKK